MTKWCADNKSWVMHSVRAVLNEHVKSLKYLFSFEKFSSSVVYRSLWVFDGPALSWDTQKTFSIQSNAQRSSAQLCSALHSGPDQPRIQTEVLGQPLPRSLIRLHCSLVGYWMIGWLIILCLFPFWTIVLWPVSISNPPESLDEQTSTSGSYFRPGQHFL